MRTTIWITAVIVTAICATAVAAPSDDIVVSHFEPLQRLAVDKGVSSDERKLRTTGPVSLRFDALGRSFDLQLEPNSVLLPAALQASLASDIGVYRGRVAGNPDSWARIVLSAGVPAGLIWDGEQLFAVEAPGDSAVATDVPIIFRLADTYVVPGTMSCGTDTSSATAAAGYQKLVGELRGAVSQSAGAIKEITLGAIGDYEFTNLKGANAQSAIMTRLNNVDGIYSEQLGVQIKLETVETFTDPNDPFSDATDPTVLLGELSDYRQATPAQNSQGLTHLFTGRNLEGSTVGLAYLSALCSVRGGAGLTEGDHDATTDSLIAAHEIGHNFGAPHDAEAGSPCESTPPNYIMAPSVNGSDQFSQCSIDQMQDDIADASCITALPTVDMSISLGSATTLLLGADTDLQFDLSNGGTLDAANVGVDITLPSNLGLVSAAASSGSCSSGAGTVSCALGTVTGLSSGSVSLSVTPSSVGTDTLTATVTTTDTDERPGNDQQVLQITVDPAVNLTIAATNTPKIDIDTPVSVSTTIGNLAVLDATGVTLTVTLDNGLRADSAAWSAGSCTVAAQRIDCQAASLPAGTNSTLTLGMTGTTAGTKHYSVTLSSSEADTDPADNRLDGTVKVSSPDKGSSGGGAGPLFLLLLALGALARGYRSRYSA